MSCFNAVLIFSLFILLLGAAPSCENQEVPATLKETNWYSRFYQYHINYYFETDSTGFSEEGQVAWSVPVDTTLLGIPGNRILYYEPDRFRYNITDTVLTIIYKGGAEKEFYYRKQYNNWISGYEYVYGKECLVKGERKTLFD